MGIAGCCEIKQFSTPCFSTDFDAGYGDNDVDILGDVNDRINDWTSDLP